MSEQRHARGIVDTSVVIELERIDPNHLPVELALSAVTLAELAAGPHATADPEERARRQAAARAYGRVDAAVAAAGRRARGRRAVDLLIAATALSSELPLYTRNASDFAGLDHLLVVVGVPLPG
jgi:predicted nucleic acid-binding protein